MNAKYLLAAALLVAATPLSVRADNDAQVAAARTSVSWSHPKGSGELHVGDYVEPQTVITSDANGRASLILPDQMLLKIAEDTVFSYGGASAGSETRGEIKKGRVWLRGQKSGGAFSVTTPTAVAAIRGTEWFVEVGDGGRTTVGVIDGTVEVSNALGAVVLDADEAAVVEPGKAPQKIAYLKPSNAVNWTLPYRLYWSPDAASSAGAFAADANETAQALAAGDVARATKILEANKQYSTSPEWQFLHGYLRLSHGDLAAAEKSFAAAQTQGSQSAALQRVVISLINDRGAQAEALSRDALAGSPKSAESHLARALALKSTLELEAAYTAAKEAVRLSPRFIDARLVAATLALELDRLKESENFLDWDNDAPNAEREALRGYLELRRGQDLSALACFDRALKIDPDVPDAHAGRGIALFNLNRSEEGLTALLAATLLSPQVSSYQSYVAKALYDLYRPADAFKAIERAKRLDPKDPTPYLYEALAEYALHHPGKAYTALVEARKRNRNRAVFRSSYLLEQDSSVLTSNVATILDDLGFNVSSTQEAARAVEENPADPGAHRRLFFALLSDPRSFDQAAGSELLLAKIFSPPTRNGVIFTERTLSPYQSLFNRQGVEGSVSGRYAYSDGESTQSTSAGSQIVGAGKASGPLAGAVTATPVYGTDISTSDGQSNENEKLVVTASDQDSLRQEYSGFIKWKPTAHSDLFFGLRGEVSDTDRDLNGFRRADSRARTKMMTMPPPKPQDDSRPPQNQPPQNQPAPPQNGSPPASNAPSPPPMMPVPPESPLNPPPEIAPMSPEVDPTPSTVEQALETNKKIYRFDTGGQASTENGWTFLAHGQYRIDRTDESTDIFTAMNNESSDSDIDDDSWIGQTALWKSWEQHHSSIGGRYYTNDSSGTRSSDIGLIERDDSTDGEVSFASVFLSDVWRVSPSLTLFGSLRYDRTSFETSENGDLDNDYFNPSAGMRFELMSNLYLRAAYIEYTSGDRGERLEHAMIAGFPSQRVVRADPYNAFQLFNLFERTYEVAFDYLVPDPTVQTGIEFGFDEQETESLDAESDSTEVLETDNNIRRWVAYGEWLANEQLAFSARYSHDRPDYPSPAQLHNASVGGAYFFENGLALRARVAYAVQQNTGENQDDTRVWQFSPTVEGYPGYGSLRFELRGLIDDARTRQVLVGFIWYLR